MEIIKSPLAMKKTMKNYLISFIQNSRLILAKVKANYLDKRLGIEVDDYNASNQSYASGLYGDSQVYQPSFYGRLEKMMKYLKPTVNDVFVDLGSGKGRVVFFVATYRLKRVIGVELDKKLFDIAQNNFKKLRINTTPINLINTDAASFTVKEENIFYMFNPFGSKTVERVLQNIKESLLSNPRSIRIVYYAPAHRQLLDGQDWLIFDGQIENKDCLVWRNK